MPPSKGCRRGFRLVSGLRKNLRPLLPVRLPAGAGYGIDSPWEYAVGAW